MHPTTRHRTWWCALWPSPQGAIGSLVAFLFFGGLDLLVYLAGPGTSGWAGPHAALVMHLAVDVSLLLLARYPLGVATLTLLVGLAMLGSDLFAPGLLAPLAPATAAAVPAATPAVIVTLVRLHRRRAAFAFVAAFTVLATRPWMPSWTTTPFGLLNTAVPALLVMYFGARKQLLDSLRDRAERAEREQELLAERARAQERRLLAAEMHDVVTHRLSLMVLHAGALGVVSSDQAVRTAAEDIRTAGTQALDELRDLVGVLRSEQPEGTGTALDPASRSDARIPDPATLVAEAREVGEDVALVVDGSAPQLSPTVARTAYRIVQEALTNIRKHAPGAETRVELRRDRVDGVRIEVTNGPARRPRDEVLARSGSGSGLIGLRQRVELIGGVLDANASSDGGYRLSAILPAYVPTQESGLHDSGDRRR